jgi:hypothetical protein
MLIIRRLAIFLFAGAIAACAAPSGNPANQTIPISPAQTNIKHSWIEPGAASGDLLYVSDDGLGAVLVYAYTPHAIRFVGEILQPTQPGPICVDKQQNVWILGSYNSESYQATEYAHGGTSPIDLINDPAGFTTGCAVDPSTGNLAISSRPAVNGELPTIAVYVPGSHKPALHPDKAVPFLSDCCAYDPHGNLYGYSGEANGDTTLFELPAKSRKFRTVALNRDIDDYYGLQWVGKYLTIGDGDSIDEYTIAKGAGTLAKSIVLSDLSYPQRYEVVRNRIIVANYPIQGPGDVGLYDYPNGGSPLGRRQFNKPIAVAVSRGTP